MIFLLSYPSEGYVILRSLEGKAPILLVSFVPWILLTTPPSQLTAGGQNGWALEKVLPAVHMAIKRYHVQHRLTLRLPLQRHETSTPQRNAQASCCMRCTWKTEWAAYWDAEGHSLQLPPPPQVENVANIGSASKIETFNFDTHATIEFKLMTANVLSWELRLPWIS